MIFNSINKLENYKSKPITSLEKQKDLNLEILEEKFISEKGSENIV